MPASLDELRAWSQARIEVRVGETWIELPPACSAERPPLPFSLQPVTWIAAPSDPGALEALTRAAGQAGVATLPARLDGRPACALHGASRSRAMKLAYKRKESLILGLFPERAEVVYTGLGARR